MSLLSLGFIYFQRRDDVVKAGIFGFFHIPYDNTSQLQSNWKTHTDEAHGFSFEYPERWGELKGTEVALGNSEPSGVSVTPFEVENCKTADNYFQEEVLPYYPGRRKVPIPNPKLDGFIIESLHLDNVTPGPEAYIINCPYVIRLGFNPEGFDDGDVVFEKILSSFKTWAPTE